MNTSGIREMKQILVKKINDENSSFSYSDIKIVDKDGMYLLTIKDYEHITFEFIFSIDDYFGYEVFVNAVYTNYPDERYNITYQSSKQYYDVRHSLIILGFHISNTF